MIEGIFVLNYLMLDYLSSIRTYIYILMYKYFLPDAYK